MSSEDANDYLNEMAQGNPANVNEFRVMTTSLEKVMNKIQSKKQSRKLGRYSMSTSYRIQPSTRQCENADRILGMGKAGKRKEESNLKKNVEKDLEFSYLKDISIPMFTAKGLVLSRSSGEKFTPFYFAYEDLRDDWGKLVKRSSSKEIPQTPKVIVRDFTEIMCLSEGIKRPEPFKKDSETVEKHAEEVNILSNPGLIPPRREIDMCRRFYRNKSGYRDEFAESKLYQ